MSKLFRYTTEEGSFEEDTYPPTGVIELIFQRGSIRFDADKVRSHESHPLHEKAMTELPAGLIVLRVNNTKVRTFPIVPPTMEELYADCNYFIKIPDLAYATNLRVMNLANGRIDEFLGALPPNLHTLDVRDNAIRRYPAVFNNNRINIQMHGNPLKNNFDITRDTEWLRMKAREEAIRRIRVEMVAAAAVAAVEAGVEGEAGVEEADLQAQAEAQYELLQTQRRAQGQGQGQFGIQEPIPWGGLQGQFLELREQGQGQLPAQGQIRAQLPRPHNRPIHEDTQNVHASTVQSSTDNNIKYIINKRKNIPHNPNFMRDVNRGLIQFEAVRSRNIFMKLPSYIYRLMVGETPEVAILKGFLSTPYSMHGHKFSYILESAWLLIQSQEDKEIKNQLLQRLCEEVQDGKFRCLGGMVVRICNIFIGFDTNINITLSGTEIIQSRIPATMKRIKTEMNIAEDAEEIPDEYWYKCISETEKDLTDVNIDVAVWGEWLLPLFDPVVDTLRENVVKEFGRMWFIECVDSVRKLLTKKGITPMDWNIRALRGSDFR